MMLRASALSLDLRSPSNSWLWGVYVVSLIGLIVIPLPAILLDFLVAVNFGLAFLLLLTTLYSKSFIELSTFPTLILLTTVLRLSVSVATSRAVLSGGDPGSIVTAFGSYVVSGSLAVGLTIFLVILIVQFMVVTKGAERISEVSARFTLDSLPGRQMSIEADARAGRIDAEEASRQRAVLRDESQLIGALEGAMRFVKGDAIATFIIVFLNLVGGLSIAVLERGESLSAAADHFLVLSIGDGVVAQLPSMLSGLAAGILITRSGASSGEIGKKIGLEMGASRGAVFGTAAVVGGMALIPGFPMAIMLLMSLILLAPAIYRRFVPVPSGQLELSGEDKASNAKFMQLASYSDQFVCRIHPDDFAFLKSAGFSNVMKACRRETVRLCGIKLPVLTFEVDPKQQAGDLDMLFEGVKMRRCIFNRAEGKTRLADLSKEIDEVVYSGHVASMTIDDLDDWLKDSEERFVGLVASVKALDQEIVLKAFRRLLQERVSVAHARPILEAFSTAARVDNSALPMLVDAARLSLRELIVQSAQGEISALTRDDELVIEALALIEKASEVESFDTFMETEASGRLLGEKFRKYAMDGGYKAICVPADLRYFISTLTLQHSEFLAVLSENEVLINNLK